MLNGEVLLRGSDNRMEQCPGMSCRRDVGRLGHSLLLGSCLRNEVQEHQSGGDSSCSADLHCLLPPLQSQGLNSMFSIRPTVLTYLLTELSSARLPARCRSNEPHLIAFSPGFVSFSPSSRVPTWHSVTRISQL